MKIAKKYLDTFEEVIKQVYGRNLVIGGLSALQMHGLITREIQDFDIIIYQPTSAQFAALENMSPFKYIETDKAKKEDEYQEMDGAPRRSFKFKKDGLIIDFLIEHGEQPQDVLQFLFSARAYHVQSIDVVLDAKRKYGRKKDYKDLIELQRNFGI